MQALPARRVHLCLLAFLAIWFFAIGQTLGWNEFCDGMENYAVATSRELLREQHWLVPTLGRQVRFEKPPLTHWTNAIGLTVLPFKLETAVRLPTLLLGVLAGLFTYVAGTMAGRKLCVADNEHPSGGYLVGLLSTVCLLTTPFMLKYVWRASYDPQLTVWIAGFWCFFSIAALTKHRWTGAIGCGLSLGAALMTKGPPALVFAAVPILMMAGWSFRDRTSGEVFRRWWGPFCLAVVLSAGSIVLWWFHVNDITGGYAGSELGGQILLKDEQMLEKLRRNYAMVLLPLALAGPWLIGLLAAALLGLSSVRSADADPALAHVRLNNRRWITALLAGVCLPAVLMIIAAPLRERYLLPTAVPAALAAGIGLRWLLGIAHKDAISRALLSFTAMFGPILSIIAAGSGLLYFKNPAGVHPSVMLVAVMALSGLTVTCWTWVAIRRNRWLLSLAGCAMGMVLAQGFYAWTQQYDEKGRSTVRPQAVSLLANYPNTQWAQWVGDRLRPTLPDELNIYANRTVVPVNPAILAAPHPAYLLAVDLANQSPPQSAVATDLTLFSPGGRQQWRWHEVPASAADPSAELPTAMPSASPPRQ